LRGGGEPTISWGPQAQEFFFGLGWDDCGGQILANTEGFPLILFRSLLPSTVMFYIVLAFVHLRPSCVTKKSLILAHRISNRHVI
jgi:hypothetical protein